MKELLEPYLVQMLEAAKTGAEFLMGELPKFAEEIIKWGIAVHAIGSITGLTILIVAVIFTIKMSNYTKVNDQNEVDWDYSWTPWLYTITAGVGYVVSLPLFFYNLIPMIKAIVAPRLYLIEELGKMLSGN